MNEQTQSIGGGMAKPRRPKISDRISEGHGLLTEILDCLRTLTEINENLGGLGTDGEEVACEAPGTAHDESLQGDTDRLISRIRVLRSGLEAEVNKLRERL